MPVEIVLFGRVAHRDLRQAHKINCLYRADNVLLVGQRNYSPRNCTCVVRLGDRRTHGREA